MPPPVSLPSRWQLSLNPSAHHSQLSASMEVPASTHRCGCSSRAGLKQQHCRVHLYLGQWAQAAAPLVGRGEDGAAVTQAADRAASGTSSSCATAGGAGASVMPRLPGAGIDFPCCTVAAPAADGRSEAWCGCGGWHTWTRDGPAGQEEVDR